MVLANLLTDTGATVAIGNTMLYRQICPMIACLHHKEKLLLPMESLCQSWIKLLPILNLKFSIAQALL